MINKTHLMKNFSDNPENAVLNLFSGNNCRFERNQRKFHGLNSVSNKT
jgi:hypothetical protein